MTLDALNHLDPAAAEAELARCCGSRKWASAMAGARPFTSVEDLVITSDAVWQSLPPAEWLEAFAAHPKIGEKPSASSSSSSWSNREQAGMQDADAEGRSRLAEGNAAYQSRFGYIFIICATGKSAAELLHALETRLSNDPDVELRVAAEEQRRITGLRLAKLMDGH